MNDRELLELAAKAAGIKVDWRKSVECFCYSSSPYNVAWSPLNDDGDALRLAVRLGFTVRVYKDRMEPFTRVEAHVTGAPRNADHCICEEEHRGDADRASRRAIVRAAAAIGANDVAHA